MFNNTGEIKALIELIDDPDEIVFKSITDRFVGLGKEVVPFIKEQLDFTDEESTIFKINHIIHKVNFNLLEADLLKWGKSSQNNLWEASLIISGYFDVETNRKEIQFEIEKVKRSIWLELNDYLTSLEEVNVINKVLFSYYKFSSYLTQDSKEIDFGLSSILLNRSGSPFMLATFYLLLAEMLKLPIKALEVPNQHLLGYCSHDQLRQNQDIEEVLFFIDPTSGQIHTHHDIDNYLKKINHHTDSASLKPMTGNTYITNWLMQISDFYQKNKQPDKADDFFQLSLKLQ